MTWSDLLIAGGVYTVAYVAVMYFVGMNVQERNIVVSMLRRGKLYI